MASSQKHHPRLVDALVSLLAVVTLLLDLRTTSAAILVGLLLIILAARSQYRPRPLQMGLMILALLIVAGGGLWLARARTSTRPITAVVEDVVLQIRHRRAQEAAGAASQLRSGVDVYTATGSDLPSRAEAASDAAPFSITSDVLEPLGYALFAPAPWQAHSLTEVGASAEMLVWYVLLLASCVAWRVGPRQPLFLICLLIYGILNWLILAASEGNIGNLLRHRLLLDPVLLILGGAGLEWLWQRAGRPFSTHMPAVLVPAQATD